MSSATAANAVMLGGGYFNPLTGYMTKADALSVANNMKTTSGLFWPVPILNLVKDAGKIKAGDRIALKDPNVPGNPVLAIMDVKAVEEFSDAEMKMISEKVYRPSPNEAHPGVEAFNKAHPGRELTLKITQDVLNEEVLVEQQMERQFTLVDRNLTVKASGVIQSKASQKDAAIASVRSDQYEEFRYANGLTVGSRGTGEISSNRNQFLLHLTVHVEVNGQAYFERTWLKSVPRFFV